MSVEKLTFDDMFKKKFITSKHLLEMFGYIRKSKTRESESTCCRLLNQMINTKRERNFCIKVFAFAKSNADEAFEDRGKNGDVSL